MRLFIYAIIVLASIIRSDAQTPQFIVNKPVISSPTGTFYPMKAVNGKSQAIYYASEFSSAPPGVMTAIYIKTGSALTSNAGYVNLEVKLGYVTDDTFSRIAPVYFTGLTSVASHSKYTVTGPLAAGSWVKIPLQQTFSYVPSEQNNLIVEISHGPDTPKNSFGLAAFSGISRRLDGTRTAPVSSTTDLIPILGFDIVPTGISSIGTAIDLRVFPNPSKGQFSVEVKAVKSIRSLEVLMINSSGSQVFQKHYQPNSMKFSEKIATDGLAQGNYFIKIVVDQVDRYRSIWID